MKRVVVESPYAGDIAENEAYAKKCVLDCLKRGEAPIASHLLLTQRGLLLDTDKEQRKQGIAAGHAWILVADLVVFYLDKGLSSGMEQAAKLAREHNVPCEARSLDGRSMPFTGLGDL